MSKPETARDIARRMMSFGRALTLKTAAAEHGNLKDTMRGRYPTATDLYWAIQGEMLRAA